MPTQKSRPAGRSGRAAKSVVRDAQTAVSAPRPKGSTTVADEGFYRDLVWNLRNGVVAVTRDGRIAVMNEVAYHILGLRPNDGDIGLPFMEVLRDRPDVARIVAGAFDLSHLPNRAELRLKSTGRVIGYTLSQVRDARGRITGATLFFKDLTRVEQLEERERLRDRLAALGEMAAAIAHEVKNPLAGIEVMAGLLKRLLSDSRDAQYILQDIIKEAKMANAIVQEVLEFVRPIRLQVERTDIAHAVQSAVQLADSKMKRGGIAVDVKMAAGLPEIQGDQHQLTQLFTNLLMNAYEAMDAHGRVSVTAGTVRVPDGGAGREAVRVEFADDGPGMAEDVAEHIFDPFFTTKAQGSGLGLAIVRKIVDAHDGSIDLRTAPGKGTLIRLTLPVSSAPDN